MRPRFVFRLRPETGSLYVRVHVYETLDGLRSRSRWLHRHGFSSDFVGRRCRGFVTDWQRWWVPRHGKTRRDQCVAEVNLAWRFSTMRIVTHEMFHATMAWARRVRVPFDSLDREPVNRLEERLAYVHGELCREFMVRAEAAGLYEQRGWRRAA